MRNLYPRHELVSFSILQAFQSQFHPYYTELRATDGAAGLDIAESTQVLFLHYANLSTAQHSSSSLFHPLLDIHVSGSLVHAVGCLVLSHIFSEGPVVNALNVDLGCFF